MPKTDLDYLLRHTAWLLRLVTKHAGGFAHADCIDTATRLETLARQLSDIPEPRLPDAEQRERIRDVFLKLGGMEAFNQLEFPGCWVCPNTHSVGEVSSALEAAGLDPNYRGSEDEGGGGGGNLVFQPKAPLQDPP